MEASFQSNTTTTGDATVARSFSKGVHGQILRSCCRRIRGGANSEPWRYALSSAISTLSTRIICRPLVAVVSPGDPLVWKPPRKPRPEPRPVHDRHRNTINSQRRPGPTLRSTCPSGRPSQKNFKFRKRAETRDPRLYKRPIKHLPAEGKQQHSTTHLSRARLNIHRRLSAL